MNIREIKNNEIDKVRDDIITPHQRNPEDYTFKITDRTTFVAESDGELYGTMSLKKVNINKVHQHCSVIDKSISEHVDIEGDIGFLCTAYISPKHTGEGIGQKLLEHLENVASDMNLDHLLTEAWIHGGNDSPDKLLEPNDYKILNLPKEMTDKSWVIDTENCVKCSGKCDCKARIYHKII